MNIQNGACAPMGSACLEKAELAFRDALQATFGPLDWLPVADGTIHRFRVPDDKPGTLMNLKNLGFPFANDEHILVMTDTSNKEARRQAVLYRSYGDDEL